MSVKRYSSEYKRWQPFVIEDIRRILGGSSGGIVAGSGGAMIAHALNGPYHTGELDPDQATWAVTDTEFLAHAADPDAHHARQHVLANAAGLGPDHTVSGLTAGQVLRATGAATARFMTLSHTDLSGVTADQHHAQQHNIVGSDHTLTGTQYQLVGATATDTLGLLTPSANPGSASAILRTDGSGALTLVQLGLGANMTLYSSGNIATGPDIQWAGSAVVAAETSLYINADSTNTGSGAIIFSKGANTSAATELARIGNNGRLGIGTNGPSYELDVVGTARASVALRTADVIATANVRAPSVDTASGQLTLAPANNITEAIGRLRTPRLDTNTGQDMTISPDGDLYLSPAGLDTVVAQGSSFRSDNFLKTVLTAGFRIGPTTVAGQSAVVAGSAEFDELRVRVFVADETRVDRGQWYLTKSYGILSRPFTVPAAVGGTAGIYFENSPHIAGALFSSNDWLMLGYLDLSGGIVLTRVWGQVSAYTTVGLTGEQRWTFTLRAGTGGLDFPKGAAGFDFGSATGGYFLLADTVTATAPNMQVGRWVTNPYTPANYTVLTQMGRLDGVGFTGEYGLAAAVGAYGTDDPWIKVSTAGAQLNNLPLVLTNGGAAKVYIGAWNNVWLGPNSSDKRLSWDGSTFAIVGTVTANAGAIANWGIGIVDANTISSSNIRLVSGTSGTARLEIGASGDNYAGVISRSTAAGVVFWAGKAYGSETSAPYRVALNGDLFASNATIVGNVTATTGYIGTATDGWAIDGNSITANGIRLYALRGTADSSRIELGDYANIAAGQLPVIGMRGVSAANVLTSTIALWAGRNYGNRASAPFRVTYGGDLIATSATISGGTAGGWTITSGQISSTNIRLISGAGPGARLEVGSSGNAFAGVAAGVNGYDVIMWAGDAWANLDSSTPFRVTLAGELFATAADVTGVIRATSGYIGGAAGGWAIAANQITSTGIGLYAGAAGTARLQVGSGASGAGIVSPASGLDTVIWAGADYTGRAAAKFAVQADGVMYATNAILSGAAISNANVSSLYAGNNAVRLATDGQRFLLPNVTSVDVPTSSSALRWFSSIDGTFTAAQNYTGLVGYRHTTYNTVDMLYTAYVGSTDYATYAARFILQAGHSDGSAYTDTRLEVVREAGSGGKYVGIYADRMEMNGSVRLMALGATPAIGGSAESAHVYFKADKLIIAYNDAGTVRYKYLSLNNTGVTWQHTTTAP